MRIRLQGSGHAARLLSELNRCRLSRLLCDVVLQIGGRSFPAHRAVLACACTHFNSLFSRGSRNGSIPTTLSLDFVSATNFEKVLTFIYTGEIFTDLIDVGVLYELAERLGVKELVSACHATFPDLQSSSSGDPVADGDMESEMVSVATVATSVCSSSAASCSSLSSSAAPTPVTPSPVPQGRNSRRNRSHSATVSLSQSPKNEDLHLEYSQLVTNKPSPPDSNRSAEALPGLTLQLKTERDDEGDAGGNISVDHLVVNGSKSTFGSPPETRSIPDSSAQLGGETCAPSSSSNDPLDSLQLGSVAGGVGVKDLGFFEDDDARKRQHMQEEQTEAGDQWRALSEDIIELSDEEEHYIVEEEDDEDLMCIENGEHGTLGQLASSQPCKACGMLLPAENSIIRTHAETHLSETGSCQVCGASFSEHGAGVTHALTHVGILLFSCDICEQQFQSEAALIHHRRQSATKCSPQNPEHLNPDAPSRRQGGELQCAVCAKVTANDFKAVREHVQSHTCLRTLRCGVCQLAQSSRCALLWHTLTHLFPIYTCPQCGSPFLESSLLDRHLALHAEEEPSAKQDGNSPETSGESQVELRCFLCPQIFRSESAFHYHLSVHSNELQGSQVWPSKRKADQLLEYSSSSSSPLEAGGSSGKSGSAGFNVSLGFSLQDRGPPFPANGNSGAVSSGAGLRQKWYRCRYCGKHFAHSGEFTYHLRIHTGEKPYQCKVCLRFFRGRSTMICHLKTHSGALMYRCTVCGLFFSTLKMVSSHMELHKDQLPPDFNIEETFMYNDHSKEPVPNMDT